MSAARCYQVRCDACGTGEILPTQTAAQAREILRARGWARTRARGDYCQVCAKLRRRTGRR